MPDSLQGALSPDPHAARGSACALRTPHPHPQQCMCRYISEEYNGVALHPINMLDAATGALRNSLVDPNLELINPVNICHPLLDVVLTGSSGNIYCWRPDEVRTLWLQASSTTPCPAVALSVGTGCQACQALRPTLKHCLSCSMTRTQETTMWTCCK